MLQLDRDQANADWTKQTWDLPAYKSPEFLALLENSGMTLAHFRRLPVYREAVRQGLIVDDRWIGEGAEG